MFFLLLLFKCEFRFSIQSKYLQWLNLCACGRWMLNHKYIRNIIYCMGNMVCLPPNEWIRIQKMLGYAGKREIVYSWQILENQFGLEQSAISAHFVNIWNAWLGNQPNSLCVCSEECVRERGDWWKKGLKFKLPLIPNSNVKYCDAFFIRLNMKPVIV